MDKEKNAQGSQNKTQFKKTCVTSSQGSYSFDTSGTRVTEITKNEKSIPTTENPHQSSHSEATEEDNSKGIPSTSDLSLTIKNNNMGHNDKYEILLPLFKHLHTPSAINEILNNSDVFLSYMDFEKLSKEIEDTLVSLIAQSNTIHTQLDTIENPPCELTADNHIIITKPRVITTLMEYDVSDTETEVPLPTKNTEFWSFVRNYTDDVHTNDINWLNNKLKSYSDQNSFNIPPLGVHYTNNLLKKKTNNTSTELSTDVVELLNGVNNSVHSTGSTSALENVRSCLTEKNEELLEVNDSKPKKQLQKLAVSSNFARTLPSSVDTNVFSQTDDDDDEILNEIEKCNNSLREIQETNKKQLEYLLYKSEKNYCSKFFKDKLEIINDKIRKYKRKKNRFWTEEQETTQISKEDDEIKFLIQQRYICLAQQETVAMCNVNIKLVDEKRTGQVTIDEQHSNTILSDVKADLLNEVIVMTPSNCKKK